MCSKGKEGLLGRDVMDKGRGKQRSETGPGKSRVLPCDVLRPWGASGQEIQSAPQASCALTKQIGYKTPSLHPISSSDALLNAGPTGAPVLSRFYIPNPLVWARAPMWGLMMPARRELSISAVPETATPEIRNRGAISAGPTHVSYKLTLTRS
ncbi:hypothetical protein H920_15299 [Fukomys damarensis]|uniref:Uncharacterized protein n=1 Tax=Fukomys damarensis TaxID=885580 RepID=A0A091CYS6_FUKDA|nr:hypothetical protein H920_15299 [Fukomys damarensis]